MHSGGFILEFLNTLQITQVINQEHLKHILNADSLTSCKGVKYDMFYGGVEELSTSPRIIP